MRRTPAALAILALVLSLSPGGAAAAGAAEPVSDRDVSIPMRDGVTLKADLFRPAAEGRFPTLVYRTPYGRKHAEGNGVVHAAAKSTSTSLTVSTHATTAGHQVTLTATVSAWGYQL